MSRTAPSLKNARLWCALLFLVALIGSAFAAGQDEPDKIGIFDLKAIRSVPLNPEVIAKTKKGNLIFEEIRYTSVPGVRVYAILSYKANANKLPGIMVVDRFKAKTKEVEATNNYFAISVAPPSGNMDPTKKDTVGGPKYPVPFSLDDQYTADPKDSYIYHHTVALLRMLDYLETRPEVDLSKTVVSGYSWPGLMVALLHALDNRPCAYVLWHGLGYYADADGMSGDRPAPISRKLYEMYAAGAYAKYGKKPLWMGIALDDYFTRLDSLMEVYNNLQGERVAVYVPNRHHSETSRKELSYPNPYPWQTFWQLGTEKPSSVAEGTIQLVGGKPVYVCDVQSNEPLKTAEVLVSYGKPGNWLGRTWHTLTMKKMPEGTYGAEIPVYDPKVPFYAAAQISTEKYSFTANGIQFFEPEKLGVTAATATYGNMLFDPSKRSDLYLRTGNPTFSSEGPLGKGSVSITLDNPPIDNGMVQIQNLDIAFWKGAKEISIYLKGDGKPGPVTAYMAYDVNYYLDKSVGNFTAFPLVPTGQVFGAGWHEYVIPLSKVTNLARVGTLYIDPGVDKTNPTGKRVLQLGAVSWR